MLSRARKLNSSIRLLTRNNRLRYMGGGGDHGHHGPNLPPFARLAPSSKKLPIEVENVWDDGVAPETAVDFDAPHISTPQTFAALGIALGFLYGIFAFVSWTDPESFNPAAPNTVLVNNLDFQYDFGMISKEEYDTLKSTDDSHHDDHEHGEDHDEGEE